MTTAAARTTRLALAALLVCLALPVAAAGTEFRLVGYVAAHADTARIDAARLTAVNAAFARVEGGFIVLPGPTRDLLRRLRAVRRAHPRLRILLSVGGWAADGFSQAAATPQGRRRFAASALAILRTERLDGLDIDWEYPGHGESGIAHDDADRAQFTALLATVRATLDGAGDDRRYRLTAALADGPYVDHVDLGAIQRSLDWINLMSYDFHTSLTPTTGHHAGLYRSRADRDPGGRTAAGAVRQYLAAGVPAGKILLGAAFYGRAFGDVAPRNHGLYQRYGTFLTTYDWPRLQQLIGRDGYHRYWDAQAQAPWLWNAGKRVFVSYEDPRSLRAKAAFVREKRLGGMMYWEQGLDPDGQLFEVLAHGLGRSPASAPDATAATP